MLVLIERISISSFMFPVATRPDGSVPTTPGSARTGYGAWPPPELRIVTSRDPAARPPHASRFSPYEPDPSITTSTSVVLRVITPVDVPLATPRTTIAPDSP